MLLSFERQGYYRYKANKMVQMRLHMRVEIKEESQGEKPIQKDLDEKFNIQGKTLITQQEIKQHFLNKKRKRKKET